MNKFFKVVLGIAIVTTSIKASAQTMYTSGVYMTSSKVNSQPVTMWNYFTQDSLSIRYFSGRTTFRTITTASGSYAAILIEVPSADVKKAAVLNPGELKQLGSEMPRLTFTPTKETKMISNYNCTKIIATNVVTKKVYEVWTTKDVVMPPGAVPIYYQGIDGFPIKYVSFRDGIENIVTVLTVRNVSFPENTFFVTPDFKRITYNDYKVLSGRY